MTIFSTPGTKPFFLVLVLKIEILVETGRKMREQYKLQITQLVPILFSFTFKRVILTNKSTSNIEKHQKFNSYIELNP